MDGDRGGRIEGWIRWIRYRLDARRRSLLTAAAVCVVMGIAVWGFRASDRALPPGDEAAGQAGEAVGGTAGPKEGAGVGTEVRGGVGTEVRGGVGTEVRGGVGTEVRTGADTEERTSPGLPEGMLTTIPDDTVFDQVGEDGTFVSSGQYYKITLPQGEWRFRGVSDSMDCLDSQWGSLCVRGYRESVSPFLLPGIDIPRTKEEYIRRMTENSGNMSDYMPEILEYTYREGKSGTIVRKEIRYTDRNYESQEDEGDNGGNSDEEKGVSRYKLELDLTSPEYTYYVSVSPEKETAESIVEARKILDSFKILDTSTGICQKMEKDTFHGYYGTDTIMTSCLVLLDRDMSAEEIGEGLELVKQIRKGFLGFGSGDALAARREDSRWLGIDCQGLQQNCTKENARKVSEIFKSDVILYDEFDGDLLMVAYCDREQKHVYQRAASFDQKILQSEFQCYGEEQEFPDDLLKYMDLTKEEADAIWKGEEAVFQMEKWQELTRHMTKMPVPEEFIGIWAYGVLKDGGFEVIRR